MMDAQRRDPAADLVSSRVGINVREVCQLCGELETSSGWAGAMGTRAQRRYVERLLEGELPT